MALQGFMYDEAFDFHSDTHKLKEKNFSSEQTNFKEGEQRLPPLGACSNDIIEQQQQPQTGSYEG